MILEVSAQELIILAGVLAGNGQLVFLRRRVRRLEQLVIDGNSIGSDYRVETTKKTEQAD